MGEQKKDNQEKTVMLKKFVTVGKAEVVKKHLKSKYKKWQLNIAKWIKVDVADTHQYAMRITYKGGTSLKINDIVSNEDGDLFMVIRSELNIAILASSEAYSYKPKMYGKLYIIPKPKQ